ncbi:PEP-CTERM sorting domain-containing protein [Verrucomicrobiaceae bacterium N1E253]|uniref:PEP-CTERM sorting domain-containing protein n=1 Tax=Oceaniferula marina TaxID=2748318 RepID=A0A851GSP9_9BACT|nr:PEP-CTERM sorting domain-containing protein [Oceaniferula marina]NWK57274.1 PEP-CTERM sorting domain-containing protein [Oceaniferula marina]
MMKTRTILTIAAFLPAASFAKWDVVGIGSTHDDDYSVTAYERDKDGSYKIDKKTGLPKEKTKNYTGGLGGTSRVDAGQVQVFNTINPTGIGDATSTFLGVSDQAGEWWVATDSMSPWNNFVKETDTSTQPSFHMTNDVAAGSSFFVGLSMQHEMQEYTSEFRVANNLFPIGTEVYFGLRRNTTPSVLYLDNGVLPAAGQDGHIAVEQNLTRNGFYNPDSMEGNIAAMPDAELFGTREQFEWIHYDVGASPSDGSADDIIFTIKKTGNPSVDGVDANLIVTDWVALFVLPDDQPGIDLEDDWTNADGTLKGGVPVSETDGLDDLVFSWTVDGKGGTVGTPRWDPPGDDEPIPDTPLTQLVPEPSSVAMLLTGFGFLCFRRKRSAA